MNLVVNLVKYANEYWIPLDEYTKTRDIQHYMKLDSLKTAIHSFVTKMYPQHYRSFRGQEDIRTLYHQNEDNDMFKGFDRNSTRTGLLHMDILPKLEGKFPIRSDSKIKTDFSKFLKDYEEKVEQEKQSRDERGYSLISYRSEIIKQLEQRFEEINKQMEHLENQRTRVQQSLEQFRSIDLGFIEEDSIQSYHGEQTSTPKKEVRKQPIAMG